MAINYDLYDNEETRLRRIVMPKIRAFIEAADNSGAGINKDRPDGIVTGHELFRALKAMFRKININVPFSPKDLIREANIHSGPLAQSDKERFIDVFSERIVMLLSSKPELGNIHELMFEDIAA